MLSQEETDEIKQKIISHIESTFPEEQKSSAINQIKSMNHEEFENFLKRNNLIKNENPEQPETECVFCSIASNKINTCILEENKDAVAVLDINPVSKGHTLVISKKHTDTVGKDILAFANDVAQKIKKKLNPTKIEITRSKLFGHEVINLIPVYKNENINSERHHASMEELEQVKKELKEIKKILKPKTEKLKDHVWLPKRIP